MSVAVSPEPTDVRDVENVSDHGTGAMDTTFDVATRPDGGADEVVLPMYATYERSTPLSDPNEGVAVQVVPVLHAAICVHE